VGPEQLPVLHAADAGAVAGTRGDGKRAKAGPAPRRVRASLPADPPPRHAPPHRRRGSYPLEASGEGRPPTARVHPPRRGSRPHRSIGGLGPPQRLRAGLPLAGPRRLEPPRVRKRLGTPVSAAQ